MSVMNEIFAAPNAGSSPEISGSLPLASVESFAEEERSLLRDRCRLVFALGLIISLILIVLARGVIDRPQLPANLLERWESVLDLAHLASFTLALGSLYLGAPSVKRLQLTAFAVLAVSVVLVVFSMGVITPDYPPALMVSLLLFIPAAVIPWRVSYQAVLGIIAAATPALAQMLSYGLLPEAESYWAARGGSAAFWNQVTVMTVGLIILAATSVLVTHTLYGLHRKARQAKRLGNYLIERELGKGGMGEVFIARHARMVRPSAVKVLRATGAFDADALARFEREVQVSSSLTHPNTITIYDYGRAERGTFYYAMEYLEGLDLKRLVERFGPLRPARTVYLLAQVCGSLAEAHAMGIVHRDLKPANIFVTQRGRLVDFVKVLDFGLARQVRTRGDDGLTKTGLILGTPEYMAPEAVQNSDQIDTRADIYGLGAVAYFLLTGRPPFQSDSAVQLLIDHLKTPPRPPSELTELTIPPDLEEIILRCLAKRPEDRFQTAEELERALGVVPFDEPWTRETARAWWQLHLDAFRPVLYESRPSGTAAAEV
jgi:hypothetical protein